MNKAYLTMCIALILLPNIAMANVNTPIQISLNMSKIPLLNEIADVTTKIVTDRDASNTTVEIILPAGCKLVNGDISKKTDLKADLPEYLNSSVQFTQPGDFVLKAMAVAGPNGDRSGKGSLHLTIGKNKSLLTTPQRVHNLMLIGNEKKKTSYNATTYSVSGTQDIQITLMWQSYVDLDIHVIDPNNEEIYFAHKTSASGGSLDRDNMCGNFIMGKPENVVWPENMAPAGTYKVKVHYWDYCGDNEIPVNWNVRVTVRGQEAKNYYGTINAVDDYQDVCSFDFGADIKNFKVSGGLPKYDGKYKDIVFPRGKKPGFFDFLFPSGQRNPRFEVDATLSSVDKVVVDIYSAGSSILTVPLELTKSNEPGKYYKTWNWESKAWRNIPADIPVGEYTAIAKIIGKNGAELDHSSEQKFYVIFDSPSMPDNEKHSFLFDDTTDNIANDGKGIWFGASEIPGSPKAHGWDDAYFYDLHPFEERVVSIALDQIKQGTTNPSDAASSLYNWVLPEKHKFDCNQYLSDHKPNPNYKKPIGELSKGKNFRYSICTSKDDVTQLLNRPDKAAQCADSANLYVALLRAVGIPAHPVTADSNYGRTGYNWLFDTWTEVFLNGNWHPSHPHMEEYEWLAASRNSAGNSWGVADRYGDDMIFYAGPNWLPSDINKQAIKFGYEKLVGNVRTPVQDPSEGRPSKDDYWQQTWIMDSSQDYWKKPRYDVIGAYQKLAAAKQRNVSINPSLDKEIYSVDETLNINVTISNLIDSSITSNLTIEVISDDPATPLFGDQHLYASQQEVTLIPNASISVQDQYILPSNLSARNGYYVFASYNSELNYTNFAVVPLYELNISAPGSILNGTSSIANLTVSNPGDVPLVGLNACLNGSYNLAINDSCRSLPELPPYSSVTSSWMVTGVKPGFGLLEFAVSGAGESHISRLINVTSLQNLRIDDEYIPVSDISESSFEIKFAILNAGDMAASNISAEITLPEGVNASRTNWNIGHLGGGQNTTLSTNISFEKPEDFIINVYASDDSGHSASGIIYLDMPSMLYYPDFTDTANPNGWRSWLILQNPTTSTAKVNLDIRSRSGILLYQGNRTIASGSVATLRPRNLVGSDCSGSVVLSSNQTLVGSCQIIRNDNQMTMSYNAFDKGSEILYYPDFADSLDSNGWRSWLVVQNPTNLAANITLEIRSRAGELLFSGSQTIPAYGVSAISPRSLVGADCAGSVTVISNQSLVGISQITRNDNSNRCMSYDAIKGGSTPLYYPDFTDTNDPNSWRSLLMLQNPATFAVNVVLDIRSRSGDLLYSGSQVIPAHSVNAIRPRDLVGSDCSGSVVATSDQPIVGTCQIIKNDNGWCMSYNAIDGGSMTLLYPDFTDSTNPNSQRSLLVLQNPATFAVNIALDIRSRSGDLLYSGSQTILANGVSAIRPRDLVGSDCSGSAMITSDKPIMGICQIYGNDNMMSISPSTLRYTFNWGDGITSTTARVNSGTSASASHAWSQAGTYLVKTNATDFKGVTSGGSPPLSATISSISKPALDSESSVDNVEPGTNVSTVNNPPVDNPGPAPDNESSVGSSALAVETSPSGSDKVSRIGPLPGLKGLHETLHELTGLKHI